MAARKHTGALTPALLRAIKRDIGYRSTTKSPLRRSEVHDVLRHFGASHKAASRLSSRLVKR